MYCNEMRGSGAVWYTGCDTIAAPGEGCGRTVMSELEERLARLESEVARLRTENEQLRRSAQAFGELAERLNRALLIATAARHAQAQSGNHQGTRRLQTAGKD
jgi:uncharacterized protein (DUF3084 family)